MSNSHFKILLLLCVAMISSACSRMDLAVKWADTYTLSKIDDHFDISAQQKKEIKKDVDHAVLQIRKEMFPAYSDYLLTIRKDLIETPRNPAQLAVVVRTHRES